MTEASDLRKSLLSDASAQLLGLAVEHVKDSANEKLKSLQTDSHFRSCDWVQVKKFAYFPANGSFCSSRASDMATQGLGEYLQQDAYRRVINAEKQLLESLHIEGLLSKSTYSTLMAAADRALADHRLLQFADIADLCEISPTLTKMFRVLGSWPVLGHLLHAEMYQRVYFVMQLATGFAKCSEEVEALIHWHETDDDTTQAKFSSRKSRKFFGQQNLKTQLSSEAVFVRDGHEFSIILDKEVAMKVKDNFEANRDLASQTLMRIREAFPHIYHSIESVFATKVLLHHQSETVEKLTRTGVVNTAHAAVLQEDIERCQHVLIRAMPECQQKGLADFVSGLGWLQNRALFHEEQYAHAALQDIFPGVLHKNYKAGQYILDRNEIGEGLILVLKGVCRVACVDHRGVLRTKHVTVGHVFGEESLLEQQPNGLDVIAVSDVQTACLPRTFMGVILDKYPAILARLLEETAFLHAERLFRQLEPFCLMRSSEFHLWLHGGSYLDTNASRLNDRSDSKSWEGVKKNERLRSSTRLSSLSFKMAKTTNTRLLNKYNKVINVRYAALLLKNSCAVFFNTSNTKTIKTGPDIIFGPAEVRWHSDLEPLDCAPVLVLFNHPPPHNLNHMIRMNAVNSDVPLGKLPLWLETKVMRWKDKARQSLEARALALKHKKEAQDRRPQAVVLAPHMPGPAPPKSLNDTPSDSKVLEAHLQLKSKKSRDKVANSEKLPNGHLLNVDGYHARRFHLPALHPTGFVRQTWNLLVAVSVVFVCWKIPYEFGFEKLETGAFETIDIILEVVFWLDIVLNFNTGIVTKSGTLDCNRLVIGERYIKGWFAIDFVGSFPWYAFTTSGEQVRVSKVLQLSKLVRMGRLLRYLRNFFAFRHFMLVVGSFVFIAHWMSCIAFFLETDADDGPCLMISGNITNPDAVHSLYNATQACTTGSSFNTTACSVAFVENLKVLYSTTGSQAVSGRANCMTSGKVSAGSLYIDVLDATLQHMVGFSPWVSTSGWQHVLSVVAVCCGMAFVASLTGAITFIMTSAITATTRFREKLDYYRDEMDSMELSDGLQKKIVEFYDYLWMTQKSRVMGCGMMKDQDLSSHLKKQLASELIQAHFPLRRLKVLSRCSEECLTQLYLVMEHRVYAPNDVVCQEHSLQSEMYYISNGRALAFQGSLPIQDFCDVEDLAKEHPSLVVLRPGHFYGELGLMLQYPLEATVKALTMLELSVLTRQGLEIVYHKFPHYRLWLLKIAKQRYDDEVAANTAVQRRGERLKSWFELDAKTLSAEDLGQGSEGPVDKRIAPVPSAADTQSDKANRKPSLNGGRGGVFKPNNKVHPMQTVLSRLSGPACEPESEEQASVYNQVGNYLREEHAIEMVKKRDAVYTQALKQNWAEEEDKQIENLGNPIIRVKKRLIKIEEVLLQVLEEAKSIKRTV